MSPEEQLEIATTRALSRLSAHTSICLKRVTEEVAKFSPRNQLNLRKALLRQIPEKPLRMDIYMEVVSFYLKRNEVDITLAEYETLLYRLGLVKKDKVCKAHNPELLEKVLCIL